VLSFGASAASGAGSRSSVASSGTLVIGEVNPFTGPSAADGGEMIAGCLTSTRLVNEAGGVLGHKLQCVEADSKGDPVDAVPAVRQLLATHSNILGILGPGSGEAASTVPILNRAKMTMFAMPGQSAYDKNTYPYFWRILPPDDAEGYAMALWAKHKGYTRGASVFGNNIAAQTNVPTLLSGFKKLHRTITINQSLAQDQPSYRTEVQRMVASKPQVIFTEADPQTATTYLAELKQLHGLIPIIGSPVTIEGPWLQAVSKVIGKAELNRYWMGVEPYAVQSGPAWRVFDQVLLDRKTGVPGAKNYTGDPWSLSEYDSVNIMALAATLTKSTKPSTYNGSILKITAPGSGKTKVYSYKEGVAALKKGKAIQYIGAFGPILFNRYHNSLGAFEAVRYGNGNLPQVGVISASELATINK
jgi:branched-chain amino acid transport system substrate-binding protein